MTDLCPHILTFYVRAYRHTCSMVLHQHTFRICLKGLFVNFTKLNYKLYLDHGQKIFNLFKFLSKMRQVRIQTGILGPL